MKKINKDVMDVVFILDRSGSMGGTESDTIGGYNNYLASQKGKNVRVTTILFDNLYEVINQQQAISLVKDLTSKEYFVRGSTALLDAVGKTIELVDSYKNDKVMFIITTDGYENSSIQYNKDQIKELIKARSKWEFMYIGANVDSYGEARGLGINDKNISNYRKDAKGISKLYSSLEKASDMMYKESCINMDWKEDLENYIKENNE